MSMSLLTLFQFLETLAAYLFVTLALPCVFLNKKLSHYRFMNRVLLYFIIGNFYATNLVFLLQILHISNFFTLWIGLLAVPAIIFGRLNHFPFLDMLRSFGHSGRKFLTGSLGIRSVIDDLWRNIWRHCAGGLKKAGGNVRRNCLDWLLVIALILTVMWSYGIRMLQQFGYAASDIPVHMYWVNGMSENRSFVGGIYPLGMHAVIYLINELFGIDTYVIFRVFALVQCLAVHMMALLFLKLCCKSRYIAYLGVFLFSISNFVPTNGRYTATLPQETSMIYILPTAYYAILFFQERSRELKGKLPEKKSRLALVGLIMSFSLCVSTHFYGAITAVLFCVGIAVGHLGWLIKPAYFKRIIAAGLISVAIAVLPMGIAFAMGAPLQGSLYWATSVITGSVQQDGQDSGSAAQPEDTMDVESQGAERDFLSDVVRFSTDLWNATGRNIRVYILRMDDDAVEWYSAALRGMIIFLIAAGVMLLPGSERMYGAMLLSTGIFMFLMSVMLSAPDLGIPALMDRGRTSNFFPYVMIIAVGFTVDLCICAVTCLFKSRWPRDILSFAAVVAFCLYIWRQDMIRPPMNNSGLERNEAITCLTNIIATEPDYSWTIFSANDETQMVFGHGYHYELITFLQEIETPDEDVLTVPTETVYFFIEKIPLAAWAIGYSQPLSEEGAKEDVPRGEGLSIYMFKNRWIVMSHMYYWAQEFQRLYPNEMKVYLETDDFICYRLEQNPYRLYNLAIDYGYNSANPEGQ